MRGSVGVDGEGTAVRDSTDLKRQNILKRSFTYSLRAVKLYQYIQEQKDGAGWIIGKQ